MKNLVIASMTILLAQGVAVAKDKKAAAPKPATMESLDADKDGKLSKEEVASDTTLTSKFDASDADHDGFLDKAEFKTAHGKK